ncbi:MAG: DNA repair protein RecN [Leptospirales bacterium]|nr:DNA repair protein RecN [Leptospirales bacterium]
MLLELRIENFGIIDEMRLHPGQGLSVLTGETGAGKSLIIQSLMAVLGARVGAGVVRSGAARAILEARFQTPPDLVSNLPPGSEELVLRREIGTDGKSRSFIQGSPVTLQNLRGMACRLIELHGQHDQQRLLDPEEQLEGLDAYCGAHQLRDRVASLHQEWRALLKKLRVVSMQKEEREYRLEYLHHAVTEIDQLSPVEGEFEQLTHEKSLMQNGGKLFEDLHVASMLLTGEEHALLTGLSRIQSLLEKHETFMPEFAPALAEFREASILLENFYQSMRQQMDRLQFSPERLEDVEDRLQTYKRLHKKFGSNLAHVQSDFLREIGELEGAEVNEKQIRQEIDKVWGALMDSAELLSRLRRSSVSNLEERISAELGALGMPGAQLSIVVTREVQPEASQEGQFVITEKGLDRVEFYFQPNPGEPAQPLRKIASGGELSRIMLACKSVMMEARPVSTVVFDEVDAGVGGEVAHTIAERLKELSRESQVIVITHLAQVAARGDLHFKILKRQENGRTVSRVARLNQEYRVQEIARMMGGDRALDFARDCLAMAG